MDLKGLQNEIVNGLIKVNKERTELRGREKKDIVVKTCNQFYDSVIDKSLNLPFWLDSLIKGLVIPTLIDLFVVILKEQKIIE